MVVLHNIHYLFTCSLKQNKTSGIYDCINISGVAVESTISGMVLYYTHISSILFMHVYFQGG